MIDEYELNADGLTESLSFPALADSTSQQAGLIYGVETSSAVSSPRIENGVLQLPESSGGSDITDVVYSFYASQPVISGQTITHPYAQTAFGVAGVVSGEISVSHVSAPLIENGKIYLPLAQYAESASVTLGMVGRIEYNSAVSAPSIIDGVITLPSGSGSDITEVLYTQSASAPVIESGIIKHPYAQTALGSSVAGVMSGSIGVSPVSAPYIENGNMILPYAQYKNGSSVTGLVAGIMYNSSIEAPSISDGLIQLPSGSGTVLGLRDMYGNPIAWEDLPTAENAIVLSTHYVGSYKYDLKAYVSDGYLGLQIIQDFDS